MASNAIEVPVDSYIERLLIGSILVCSGKSMDGMRATLETPDFGLEAHRRIWDAMCTLYDASGSLDHATLARELQRRSQLESVGGLAYLIDLEEGMPEYPCLDQYVDKLKDTGLARRILVLIDHLQKRVASGLETGAELREALVASVSDLMPTASKDHRPVSTAELVDQLGVDELMSPRMEEGVRLPWGRLNAALHGLRGGQSVVLAADTGRGKTSLACQISTHITRQGRSVLYWTMEMPPRALFRRMVNQMTGTDRRHAKPTFESREMEREAVGWLYEHPIYFDQHSRTVPGFCASIRQVQHQTKLGLIVVDYLGLIRAAGRAESRTREVGENSRSLKLAAA